MAIYDESSSTMPEQFDCVTGRSADLEDCPTRLRPSAPCRCEPVCAVCGFGEHMAIHGPRHGDGPGGRPYGHEFEPKTNRDK